MSGTAPVEAQRLVQADAGDLLTLSFVDPQADVSAQLRVAQPPAGPRQTLIAVFRGSEPRVATAITAGAPTVTDVVAGKRWSASWPGGESGEGAFALELAASGPAVHVDDPQGPVRDSVQQPCLVSGTITLAGDRIELAASGQLGLVHGAADWSARTLWREIDCWLAPGRTLAVRASRPRGAGDHAGERAAAVLVEGEPPLAGSIDETRVSSVYDGEGRLRQAGLELWPDEDSDYPRRLAGHTLCAATVRTAAADGQPGLRWDCAFLHWHMEGAEGLGPYSIVRAESD